MTTVAISPDSIRDEMREKIRAIASLCPGSTSIKAGLSWAARKARITTGEAKRLAYSEMTIVPAHIADQVRIAARDLQVEMDIAAAERLLAQIQKDEMHAALARRALEGLAAVAAKAPDCRTPPGS